MYVTLKYVVNMYSSYIYICLIGTTQKYLLGEKQDMKLLYFLILFTPHSTISQLLLSVFFIEENPRTCNKTTDPPQVIAILYYIKLYRIPLMVQ